MNRMTKHILKYFVLAMLLPLFFCGTIAQAEADSARLDQSGIYALEQESVIKELRWLVEDETMEGWSYHTVYGYNETKCEPADFIRKMQIAMSIPGDKERTEGMHAVLSTLGFARDEWAARYIEQMDAIELIEYGRVPAIVGEVSVSVVDLHSSWNHFFYIFVQRSSEWFLIDRFMMDYWALDEVYPTLQLMKHSEGKPGAWFQVCSIVHGTGVYADYRQWYNVFTRRYDFAYILEGYDVNGGPEEMCYYARWKGELEFTTDDAGDVLRFTTYEEITKYPFDWEDDLGEEVDSSMMAYEYSYNDQAASYVRTGVARCLPMNLVSEDFWN